jgi:hypothetical protein
MPLKGCHESQSWPRKKEERERKCADVHFRERNSERLSGYPDGDYPIPMRKGGKPHMTHFLRFLY